MRVELDYGKGLLPVELPDGFEVRVIRPVSKKGKTDPAGEVRRALEEPIGMPPLSLFVKPADRVGVVVNDITRATPYRLILPTLLESLSHIERSQITFFVALGTHRRNTDDELGSILGEDVVSGYEIVQNDAFDVFTQMSAGTTSRGTEVLLNKRFFECDKKILTGFIEPHFFAGFSGGPKAVVPGMAGISTVMKNHCAGHIDHPGSTWGVTRGNPLWEEIREACEMVCGTFLLNVTLNREKQITAVFAGDLDGAHRAGCALVKETSMVGVEGPFDIVITSNSGYPLDLNLYQAVKGMSAASQIVREGGAVVIAADCWDGIPSHGEYGRLLQEARDPRSLLETVRRPGFAKQDAWQAQIQARIQLFADVFVYSKNLSRRQIESALLQKTDRIEDTVGMLLSRYGQDARVCVLPEGPQTIPYLKQTGSDL
jgi:nickel-dependent lactate racemase